MPNFENFFVYEHWQFDLVRHLLSLTVAVFAAGLLYFVMTKDTIAPRFRLSSSISAVVMVSAVLEIGQLLYLWSTGFTFVNGVWALIPGNIFSNGFRYVNWSIDVPMLLTQLLVVLGLSGAAFWSEWRKLTIAGLFMIWTGYPGQFFEPAVAGIAPGLDGTPFWIWGAISTVFFVYLLYKVGMLIGRPAEPQSPEVRHNFKLLWGIVLFSWTLYPLAYGVPAVWASADGAVVRQVLFTIADITSKLIFGVVLGRIARIRSKEIGYEPAIAAG